MTRPLQTLLRIVSAVVVVAWSASSTATADSKIIAEKGTDLGFGFRKVLRSQRNPPGSFEGIGHFSILYYREQEIGQHGKYLLAPSGRYLVFQDGPSGDIVLFTAASGKRRVLQKYPGALVRTFKWGTGEREVTFEIEPIRIKIEQ